MNLYHRVMYFLAGRKAPKRQHRGSAPLRSMRAFYAGAADRLTATFNGTNLSINEALIRDLDKMRHRSRTLCYDNDYAKKFIRMVRNNIIGAKGMRLQARSLGSNGLPDKLDNDAIEKAWKDFCKLGNCSVDGKKSMLDIMRVAISGVATEGETLIRFVVNHAYKYGMMLQIIEADRLDTQLNREKTNESNKIVMGIELDDFEKPIAYYILTAHPSESVATFGNNKYMRIPAEQIIHLYLSEYAAQARGIPWMHSAIRRLNMVGGYEEAELVAARAGASKMGFYYTETGEEYKGDGEYPNGALVQEAEPGTFEQLPEGVRFETYDPQHPTGAYNYFLRGTMRGASAGLGVSYTGLTGDLEAVNYSSIRAGLIEEREMWREMQGWFKEHAMDRIYSEWLKFALTMGLIVNDAGVKLPLSKKDKFLEVRWQARGWAWVDPLKDQQANDAAVASGHKTNSSVISAQGDDIEEVYETLAWEKKLAESYGLEFGVKPAANDNEDKSNDDKDKEEDDDEE